MDKQELPLGWVWTTLLEVTAKIGDVDHRMPKQATSTIPYISTKDFTDEDDISFEGAKTISEADYKALSRKIKPEFGDILLSRYGTVGKVRKVRTNRQFQASYSIAIIKTLPIPALTDFLSYLLKSEVVQDQIQRDVRATAQPDLGLAHIREFRIPLPPLAEQQRIVDEIEAQFTRLDAVVTALKRAQATLKRYRASVLKTACEGRLVPQNPTDEPASQLLERILAERRQQWNGRGLYTEPTPPDTSDLLDLPVGWVWASLELVADAVDPQPSHRTPPQVENGVPYVSIGDIKNRKILLEKSRKVSKQVLEEHRARYSLREGDFIFGKIGTLGRPIKLPKPFDYTLSANVVLIQPKAEYTHPEFAFTYLASPLIESLLAKQSRATTQAAFGITRVRVLPIPLPPLAEQQRIVEEVERRLSVMDEVEASLEANLKRAERLRQSILKRAFEGKLVPQNPADEPASVLLGRIRQTRGSRQMGLPGVG